MWKPKPSEPKRYWGADEIKDEYCTDDGEHVIVTAYTTHYNRFDGYCRPFAVSRCDDDETTDDGGR